MMKPENGGWSAEMDAILARCVAKGMTARDASIKLRAAGYQKSRNACIGRALRLGHPFLAKIWLPKKQGGGLRVIPAGEPKPTPVPKAEKPAVERKGGAKLAKVSTRGNFNPIAFAPQAAESAMTKLERRKQTEVSRAAHLAHVREMEEKQPGVPFMERRQLQCVAMFGTGMHANCCGRPVTYRPDGNLSSYCAEHHKAYHSYTPRAPSKLDFTDAGVMKVKVKKPDSEDAENQEELEPVDRLIAGDEDDDTQQAA